jgi:formate-dependent nitrite reductase membrane component NrfD
MSDVTKTGLEGVRPGRDATVGVVAGRRDGRRGRRRGGEQPMVPDAEFDSYYGLPVLNAPVWHGREIAGYLFLGGLAGASSVLAAGAQVAGSRELATRAKVVATGAAALGGVALVKDLGRPARFANMLRVFKPTSPMSVGSWLLAGYVPAAGLAAATAVTGRRPRVGTVATAATVVLGPAVSTYTAALISDTAVPAWHDGYREMPFVFAGSSATAAGGIGLVVAPSSQSAPARRLAFVGAAAELVAVTTMKRRLGMVAEPYHEGRAGRLMQLGQGLTAAGLTLAVAGRRRRFLSIGAGALLAAASAVTRFGIFEAGKQSVADPRYVVDPQRAR